jgi:hypothetical protein
MAKDDAAIDPKPIISLMFAISVGFWANQLVRYVTPASESVRLQYTATELQLWLDRALGEYAHGLDPNEKLAAQRLQMAIHGRLEAHRKDPNGITASTAEILRDDVNDQVGQYAENLKPKGKKPLGKLPSRISDKLDKYVTGMQPDTKWWRRWFTLLSGVLFLFDLLCIVWWYARYIYRVQPRASFWSYFLDFLICSMFALAANSWTTPDIFLFATVWGSALLFARFVRLYYSTDASMTDRQILLHARTTLLIACGIALIGLLTADRFGDEYGVKTYYLLPGVLSSIGIFLTVWMRRKIAVAVDIYAARHAPISDAYLVWPESSLACVPEQIGLEGEAGRADELTAEERDRRMEQQRGRIRHHTEAGLRDFDNMFRQLGRHDRIYSRVHSETEIRVQSYILALPSCGNEAYAEEIEKKAFIVAVSHWLDDLVDGRNEVDVFKRLQKYRKVLNATPLSDVSEKAEELFERIYRPIVVKYTDREFYEMLHRRICESCLFPFNRKYMFLGLNRVAYGAVAFSPKLSLEQRMDILDDHNVFLKNWNVEGVGKYFENKVESVLDRVVAGGEAGEILLALTTKTVQEVAMCSESFEVNVGLSILFSILYAPLIYYHNIKAELEHDEMVPLQSFDTDSDLWIPWLKLTRSTIDSVWDERCKRRRDYYCELVRKNMRIKQIEMAYRCFEPALPKHIWSPLREIYLPQNGNGGDTA